MRLDQLSYANQNQPPSSAGSSGRSKACPAAIATSGSTRPGAGRSFRKAGMSSRACLILINIRLDIRSEWPPRNLPDGPLVIIANHPYGIGDGIAVLAMAEALGRPFRVLINNDLMKVPEIAPFALPISFDETREAMAINMATRQQAVELLKAGVTIVVFPAGGVATAPKGFGRAVDLPWKMFPARLVQAARASVIPVYFEGQCGPCSIWQAGCR
jgi:putative hemolysin